MTTLAALPGGKWLFSRLVGLRAPYSSMLGAQLVKSEPLCSLSHHARQDHLNPTGSQGSAFENIFN
jgi:hypothetical protein